MTTTRAIVPTASGGKYVRQLCKHWSHKLDVELDGEPDRETGVVRFPSGTATMTARPEALELSIAADDREEVERLKDVVARHLDRFAFREAPLPFDWKDG